MNNKCFTVVWFQLIEVEFVYIFSSSTADPDVEVVTGQATMDMSVILEQPSMLGDVTLADSQENLCSSVPEGLLEI